MVGSNITIELRREQEANIRLSGLEPIPQSVPTALGGLDLTQRHKAEKNCIHNKENRVF